MTWASVWFLQPAAVFGPVSGVPWCLSCSLSGMAKLSIEVRSATSPAAGVSVSSMKSQRVL